MHHLPRLFENNLEWAKANLEKRSDFFSHLCDIQNPEYLWIGCSDSRVPANQIVGLEPGELFVHRNVANIIPPDDLNALTVIEFAVTKLKVKHIIVCGHYNCSGVIAALEGYKDGYTGKWLHPIEKLRNEHNDELEQLDLKRRWARLCELNVVRQVKTLSELEVITSARKNNQELYLHGWIYDLADGLLHDLNVTETGEEKIH